MNSKLLRLFLAGVALASTALLWAEGFPVKSQLVRDSCGTCHRVDSEQRMTRISYARKTPEGWEETVKRMVRIHEVRLSPSDAREIVQYLADNQGLTASELDKISYTLEQRDEPEQVPNEAVKAACATCHSYAKIAAQRRTREEWLKLKDFLMAMTPTLVYQHRQIDWPKTADEALAYLAQQFPLETPEWQKEKNRPAPSDGSWLVVGSQPGKGDYVGEVSVKTASDGSREFHTAIEFSDGTKQRLTGTGRWYGGYSWRGNGQWPDGRKVREVFHLSANGQTLRGRWFTFDHSEIGGAEVRYRLDGRPTIAAVFPRALKRGARNADLKIYGSNLPSTVKAEDLNLGEGVKVEKISEASGNRMVVQVSVAGDAKVGRRAIKAAGATGQDLLAIYDTVDYIRVLPERAMARTGGERIPKKFTQFEARAFSKGADGVAGTADDLDLGPVKASWRVDEAHSSIEDDDVNYVGGIDQNGLFTPAVEGPNPARPRSTNNAGDVWVEASYTPDGGNAKALTGRAYLIVAIPLYNRNLLR
jgi:quinohemoprotein amine dehydrogenase